MHHLGATNCNWPTLLARLTLTSLTLTSLTLLASWVWTGPAAAQVTDRTAPTNAPTNTNTTTTTTAAAAVAAAPAVDLAPLQLPGLLHLAAGVTRAGTPLPAVIAAEDLDLHTPKLRILLVGGLDGSRHTPAVAIEVLRRFYSDERYAPLRDSVLLSAIPDGNPDGRPRGLQDDQGIQHEETQGQEPQVDLSVGYPPDPQAYTSTTAPESQYLWRWIGMHAPDLVVVLAAGERSGKLDDERLPVTALSRQLSQHPVGGIGAIEALTWTVPPGEMQPFRNVADPLLAGLAAGAPAQWQGQISPARRELQRRRSRQPLDVCQQLAAVYGQELESTAYIPAVAVLGRLRYAELAGAPEHRLDIQRIVEPYRSGTRTPLDDKASASDVAGQILWGALHDATGDPAYQRLVIAAAERGFNAQGEPLAAMPLHNEMSDSVFMGCPILAQAGRLTGDDRYYAMCVRHLRFMRHLNVREDGLHRHSPLDPTAWGRGNGFPALGLALVLSDLPAAHPLRMEVLDAFRQHLTALLPHQDATGAWHQVIDHPESYRELTATCMITFAIARGLDRGWLEGPQFQAAAQRGWQAIQLRVADNGELIDVCTGTGKLRSLREYLDRPAILGRDPRGGAMVLLAATEMAATGLAAAAGPASTPTSTN
jgi:unsaturated rhamnogalacturonyl hydrolase